MRSDIGTHPSYRTKQLNNHNDNDHQCDHHCGNVLNPRAPATEPSAKFLVKTPVPEPRNQENCRSSNHDVDRLKVVIVKLLFATIAQEWGRLVITVS
jgi:hypothetical protein